MSVENTKIIKKASKAYGYNYASLADIVKEGIELPLMRLCRENPDYLEYQDDKGEWNLGARIVVPDMKGSNDAQKYGAALEYARRYTTLLARKIASSDDSKIETAAPSAKPAGTSKGTDFDVIKAKLTMLDTIDEVNRYQKAIEAAVKNPTEKQRYVIQTMFANRRSELSERVA